MTTKEEMLDELIDHFTDCNDDCHDEWQDDCVIWFSRWLKLQPEGFIEMKYLELVHALNQDEWSPVLFDEDEQETPK